MCAFHLYLGMLVAWSYFIYIYLHEYQAQPHRGARQGGGDTEAGSGANGQGKEERKAGSEQVWEP